MSHKQMSNVLANAQKGGDGGLVSCAGCGRALEKEFMEPDHISPKTDDGDNHILNRILLRGPCNKRKRGKAPVGNKPMPSDPADLARAMFRQADRKIRKKNAEINYLNLVKLCI